jgi:hypothetical protein
MLSERDIAMNPTILSGDIDVVDDASDNVHHVVLAAVATTRLDGFTIMAGNADGSSNITVNGETILRNNGGGIYTSGGTNTLANNSLLGNAGFQYGGGIFSSQGTNTLTNNSLSGNTAGTSGGGIFSSQGTNTLTNNSLSGNTGGNAGGGICTQNSTNTMTNNSLSGNTASNGGGILFSGGMHILTNSIIWGNSSGIFDDGIGTLTVTYSIVQGGFAGDGNLDADPLFVDQPAVGLGTGGDLRLMASSPAIDAGTSSGAPATDLEGMSRPSGAGYDMGAFEFDAALPVEFLVFKGEYRGKANELEWTTLSELNNDYFAVQHSMDGVNFEAIGTENGRGASNTLTDYRFSHQNPSRGVHYYRLKQFDFDARFDYSDVISINVQGEEELALYPNPAQDQLTIVNGQGVAFISNVLGQSIRQFSIAENQQTIQIDDLQDSHYFLRIIRGNGEIVVKKFVKR